MLDTVLPLGLRLSCGAFRASPIKSRNVQCDKWCLMHQRIYVDLFLVFKITSMNNYPFKPVFNDTSTSQLFLNLPFTPAAFPHRVRKQASVLPVSF